MCTLVSQFLMSSLHESHWTTTVYHTCKPGTPSYSIIYTCTLLKWEFEGLTKSLILWILEIMVDVSAWEGLGVPREIQRSLSEQGFTSPTPIQTLSLPPAIFHRRDIIGAAETVCFTLSCVSFYFLCERTTVLVPLKCPYDQIFDFHFFYIFVYN